MHLFKNVQRIGKKKQNQKMENIEGDKEKVRGREADKWLKVCQGVGTKWGFGGTMVI